MRERTPRNNTAMIVGAWKVIAASLLGCSAFAEETETLKIVNWNVLYGFNHKKSVKQGANWIKKQAADVVALQELNGHNHAGPSAGVSTKPADAVLVDLELRRSGRWSRTRR